MLPETAPFPAEQIVALNSIIARTKAEQRTWLERLPRRLSGGERTTAGRRRPAGASGAAHHPVRDRIRQRRDAGRCGAQGGRQAGLRRTGARHGGCHAGAGGRRAEPAGDRQHLGRGRSAAARDRFLRRADGRRCAALRRRALCGAGAGRPRLREVLRDRPRVRRPLRRAGCDAGGRADRVRPGLRNTGRRLDRHDAGHAAGGAWRAGGGRGDPRRFRPPAGRGRRLEPGAAVRGGGDRAHPALRQPIDVRHMACRAVARGCGHCLRARRFAGVPAGERSGAGGCGAGRNGAVRQCATAWAAVAGVRYHDADGPSRPARRDRMDGRSSTCSRRRPAS